MKSEIKNDDFEKFVVKANHDLNALKHYIDEKDKLIQDLSLESKKQFASEIKIHRNLSSKLEYLQVITSMLAKKNQELEKVKIRLKQKEASAVNLQRVSMMYGHQVWL